MPGGQRASVSGRQAESSILSETSREPEQRKNNNNNNKWGGAPGQGLEQSGRSYIKESHDLLTVICLVVGGC